MSIPSNPEASEAPADPSVTTSADEAPVTAPDADQAQQPNAPAESGTSEQDPPVLETFRLEDVPEEHGVREHVSRYAKQVQGDYSRKTAQLAQERREVEAMRAEAQEAIELHQALGSDDTREQAISDLLQKHGWTVEDADEAAAAQVEAEDDGTAGDPEMARRLEALEALEAERAAQYEAQAQQEADNQILAHVDAALDAFAQSEGVKELTDSVRRQIITRAAGLPRLDDGMPDMETAIAEYEGDRAADLEAYLASKRGTVPDVTGSSGTPAVDLKDPKARLEHANRVAEAALARAR